MNNDRAFRVDAISLGDQVSLLGGALDPSIADDGTLPVGSLYLHAEGTVLQKWRLPNHWIELSRWPFAFTSDRASALDYVPTSANNKTLQYLMPVEGMVVGVFCQAGSITKAPVGVELWVEGVVHTPATIPLSESTTPTHGSQLALSADVSAGERLQIRMSDTTGVANDLMVTLLFARRST